MQGTESSTIIVLDVKNTASHTDTQLIPSSAPIFAG